MIPDLPKLDYLHKEFPKQFAKNDFWSQIKRTVNGVPVSENHIQMMVHQIESGLDFEPHDHLLDLGCGNGALASRFHGRLSAYTGVDFSNYLLEIAAEYFPGNQTRYLNSDIRETQNYFAHVKQANKILIYGVLGYLSRSEVIRLLRAIRKQLPLVQRIFVGNLPDQQHAAQFFAKRGITDFELDNPQSPIGVWWTRQQLSELGRILGFQAEFLQMPDNFYSHSYRFDVVFSPLKTKPPQTNSASASRIDGGHRDSQLHKPHAIHTERNALSFNPPISTSNLHAPDIETVWRLFSANNQNQGLTQNLEQTLQEYHGCRYCVTFGSGFWALVASMVAKARPGCTEVIIPSFTYRRLADAVYWAGFTPVMVDIDPGTLSISLEAAQAAIDDNTALILAVHPIVNCCRAQEWIELAERNEVPLLFDAVESVHETVDAKRVGSFGVGEVFSLHASKLLNGLEGGYICTDDQQFQQSLLRFRHADHEQAFDLGRSMHSPLHDAHAAFALASLNELESNVAHNHELFRVYLHELRDIPGIRLLPFDTLEQTSFKNVVAEIEPSFPMTRDDLIEALNAAGALARPHYAPALHQREYQYPVRIHSMIASEEASKKFINLPCGSRVSTLQVRQVCRWLRELAMGTSHRHTSNTRTQDDRSEDNSPTERSLPTQSSRSVFESIYQNGYFTNHGPLAQQLEDELAQHLQVQHVVATSSDSLALLIALAGIPTIEQIWLPSTDSGFAERVACWLDVPSERYQQHELAKRLARRKDSASMENICVTLIEHHDLVTEPQWPASTNDESIQLLQVSNGLQKSRYTLPPGTIQVLSLDEAKLGTSAAGGAIATNDRDLAERCRNIRSSYGRRQKLPVKATCNGRISEAQAGFGLLHLQQQRAAELAGVKHGI